MASVLVLLMAPAAILTILRFVALLPTETVLLASVVDPAPIATELSVAAAAPTPMATESLPFARTGYRKQGCCCHQRHYPLPMRWHSLPRTNCYFPTRLSSLCLQCYLAPAQSHFVRWPHWCYLMQYWIRQMPDLHYRGHRIHSQGLRFVPYRDGVIVRTATVSTYCQ